MPWEHAVLGYVGYSLFVHAAYRDAPTGEETIVVALASVLPDLIDKPLGWGLGLFESGYNVAHSVFVAVPTSLVVGALAYRRGRPRLGWAFAVAYLVHLPADVLPIYVRSGSLPVARVLWPVGPSPGVSEYGLQEGLVHYVTTYPSLLFPPESSYAVGVLGLFAFAVVLWLLDGAPVARESLLAVRSTSASLVDALSR